MWKNTILLSMVLSLAPTLFAEDSPAGIQRFVVSFKDSVGLFDYFKSDDIPDKAAQVATNIDWSIDGALHSRRGIDNVYYFNALNDISNIVGNGQAVQGARNDSFWVYRSTTDRLYLIARFESFLQAITPPEGTYAQDLTATKPFKTGQADALKTEGNFYIVSESSPITKITEVDPTSPSNKLQVSFIQNSPSGKAIKPHLDRFLVIGSTLSGYENTVLYSSPSNINSWPAFNTIEIFAKTGEYITCIGDPLFGNVPLYTNQTVRLITGSQYPDEESPGNISIRQIYDGIGCASQRSIKNLRNKQYFYSRGQGGNVPGIYEFNGVSIKEKTKPYRRWFANVVQNSTATLPTAFVYQDKYCLAVASNGVDRLGPIVCVDDTEKIYRIDGINVAMADEDKGTLWFLNDARSYINTGENINYKANIWDSNNFMDHLKIGNTSASRNPTIDWRYKTKDFGFNERGLRRNMPERIYIQADKSTSSIINLVATYDFGRATDYWRIDLSTIYSQGNTLNSSILTVENGSGSVINKLLPATGVVDKNFTHVNFEVFGSSAVSIDYLDFYYTVKQMP